MNLRQLCVLLFLPGMLTMAGCNASDEGRTPKPPPNTRIRITADSPPPKPSGDIEWRAFQNDAAREAAKRFAGKDIIEDREVIGPYGRFYEFRAGEDTITIDPETNRVIGAVWSSRLSDQPGKPVPMEVAKAEASRFANKAFPEILSAPHVFKEEEKNHGAFTEYDFIWTQTTNGVKSPNYIRVSVNANTGEIISFNAQSKPVKVPGGTPHITKQEAIRIARDHFRRGKVVEQRAELVVANIDSQGNQALVNEPMPKTPEEALARQRKEAGKVRQIPLYAVDGKTVIGSFNVGGGLSY